MQFNSNKLFLLFSAPEVNYFRCSQAALHHVWAQCGVFSINKEGTLLFWLTVGGSVISDYRSGRGKGERLGSSLQQQQKTGCVMKQEGWSLIKAVPGSVTLTSRARWALWLILATGDTSPAVTSGNKDSHYNLFHFYVHLRNENQIKTKPGGPWFCFTFLLPSFSQLFFYFSLAAFLWSVNQILLMYESEAPTVHRRPLYSARACRVQPHLNASFPSNL